MRREPRIPASRETTRIAFAELNTGAAASNGFTGSSHEGS
jgi:hypothetical protein